MIQRREFIPLLGGTPVCPKAPQMLKTINSTNPTPTNNTASATESYSSQCR